MAGEEIGIEIGRVVRLQVQTGSLKVPGPRFRGYDPGPIRSVGALVLDGGGVVGIEGSGAAVPDVHHRGHPASKFRGENGVSIGFTSHYGLMRGRFAGGLADGEAGENILVETERTWSAAELAGGLDIAGGAGVVRLAAVVVADPCVEFARFLLRWPAAARPDRRVGEAVAFLGGGVRGFYAELAGASARIAVGDRVRIAGSAGTTVAR